MIWALGLTEMRLQTAMRLGVRYVLLEWRGPGMLDEMNRRWADRPLPPLPPGFTAVTGTAVSRVAVDTVSLRRTGGVLRGRFRVDYAQPVGPEEHSFDSADYEIGADCGRRMTRLFARSLFVRGRPLSSQRWGFQEWTPPQPQGHLERGLEALCRAGASLRPG